VCRPRPFGRPAAIAATKSLDDTKLADYIHTHTFNTVMGDIKFGKDTKGQSRECWGFNIMASSRVPASKILER
jgi:hypothetical protein